MADNFGLKIGVEGEKEFKKALADINQSFKVLGSEMKLVESEFGKNENSVQSLTSKNEVLNKQIDAQKDKIETLRKALENASSSFGENDRRTAAWANLRSKLFQLPYGDQGLLLPTALYKSVGGFADIPVMEDVKLVRALRGKLMQLDATATTSAAKYDAEGYLRRGSKNLLTLSKYLVGVPPETLAKRY